MIEKFLVKTDYLRKNQNNNKLKILDCRWYITDSQKGSKEYNEGHIPSAIFVDIEKFSKSDSLLPHTMVSNYEFKKQVSKLGIHNNDELIVYDQEGFFSSSRIWYMFRSFGHKNIKILDGGYRQWRKNYEISCKIPNYAPSTYKSRFEEKYIVKKIDLENLMLAKNIKIIDARPKKRFDGFELEPRKNTRIGNIPGSINIPYTSIINDSGQLKSTKYLANFFKKIIKSKEEKIVCMCGSGITACNIIFVLNILGYVDVSLYDGSWAEWGYIEEKN